MTRELLVLVCLISLTSGVSLFATEVGENNHEWGRYGNHRSLFT